MSLACILATRDHLEDLKQTRKLIESIEDVSDPSQFSKKILSVELTEETAGTTLESLCDWARYLRWSVIVQAGRRGKSKTLCPAIMRGLKKMSSEEWVLCCESGTILRRVPNKFALTPLFQKYNVGWLNYDIGSTDLHLMNDEANWIKINFDEFVVSASSQNRLLLPAIARVEIMQNIMSYEAAHNNCAEYKFSESWSRCYENMDLLVATLVQPKTKRELPFGKLLDAERRLCVEFV